MSVSIFSPIRDPLTDSILLFIRALMGFSALNHLFKT